MSEAQGSRRDGAAGRSLRTNGFLLWLRFHSVVVATVAAVVSAGLVAALLTAVTSANGSVIEDRPYILALLVSVCLSIVFTRETPYELVCARSLTRRRLGLVLVAAAVAVVLGVATCGVGTGPYGLLAYLRDVLIFLGVALIAAGVGPAWTVWGAPLALGLGFALFSPPYRMPTSDTVWMALKAPGLLHTVEGHPDLSWAVAAVVAAVGVAVYAGGATSRGAH
ncbi:hypothetical protein [Corynebacterium bovis]|uniref:Flagellar biosynthesis protein FliQ n=1 Tax=Corynebacterium bovis DSM 20582 = CIP 54.80 TaxID=927655 RepID=A0A8I0CMW7_9CORY|nr:hypothetical protein [Corynebacterium bovis]MBB3116128.1 flagellar biosynthesis protein FliQ [Corynebacterium bovis DSM 20582 = CIP 54.80]MDK8510985.1 hypothetical protein [Corynebacterium bovis]QQC47054.1 hypothetical protein I6I09_08260 [Corynebacterium bovis]RRO79955.1 hypothetical protein CXF38_07995 [Corynebacterium bovis]RRO80204.1 hypothetical protein CXF36_08915 [Corynebacterium bovis]